MSLYEKTPTVVMGHLYKSNDATVKRIDSVTATDTQANTALAKAVQASALSRPSLFFLLGRLWHHLGFKRRRQLGGLLAIMMASGFAEAMSLAAVLPFLTVLADPVRLWDQLQSFPHTLRLGATSPQDLLLPVTLIFGVTAIVSAAIRLACLWLNGRVTAAIGSDISLEAYRRTLYQPYGVHTARNSAAVIAGVTTHINGLIYGVLHPAMQIAASTLIVMSIMASLLVFDPVTAVLTITVFAGSYAAMAAATKSRIINSSRLQAEHITDIMRTIQEGLGGIRDVLLDHSQRYYIARYREHDTPFRQLVAQAEFLGAFPRFVIEGLGLAGIALLAYVLVVRLGGIAMALPLLGTLALGFQRLLPAVQQIYSSFSQIRNSIAGLGEAVALLDQTAPTAEHPPIAPYPFRESITLCDASFRYAPNMPWIVNGANLTIKKGDRLALIGPTGGGKSTLADLLMGLLEPTEGTLLIDGQSVPAEAWQANIAHVPQAIFLADTSIEENIALGIPADEVDAARLRSAADRAQIAGFIASLPQGYKTRVGERGIRLSGGQRQRIGIARALYKQAGVLVFDEATSALDEATEKALMETLDSLSRELTIVLITHRLSMTSYCDRVFSVQNGCLTLEGSAPLQSRH